MNELIELLKTPGGGIASFGAIMALMLVLLSNYLPKIMNNFKSDSLDGSVLDRLAKMEDYAVAQALKNETQDSKIHRFAVKVTKLVVVMIRLESLLMFHRIKIPPDLQAEINELKDDPEEY